MATDEVLHSIPHRPPFLFLDEIVESDDRRLVAKRKVREDEPFFQGHYPGNPIMPGVLVSEAVFQAGAALLSRLFADDLARDPELAPMLVKIEDARFKRVTRPGDTLVLKVSFREKMGRFLFLDGAAETEGGQTVMTVSFGVALAKAPHS